MTLAHKRSGADPATETVITGPVVDRDGRAVAGAFVRLPDSSDDFTAEVIGSAGGDLRIFAAPESGGCAHCPLRATATP